jgi:hypothetical protein
VVKIRIAIEQNWQIKYIIAKASDSIQKEKYGFVFWSFKQILLLKFCKSYKQSGPSDEFKRIKHTDGNTCIINMKRYQNL